MLAGKPDTTLTGHPPLAGFDKVGRSTAGACTLPAGGGSSQYDSRGKLCPLPTWITASQASIAQLSVFVACRQSGSWRMQESLMTASLKPFGV